MRDNVKSMLADRFPWANKPLSQKQEEYFLQFLDGNQEDFSFKKMNALRDEEVEKSDIMSQIVSFFRQLQSDVNARFVMASFSEESPETQAQAQNEPFIKPLGKVYRKPLEQIEVFNAPVGSALQLVAKGRRVVAEITCNASKETLLLETPIPTGVYSVKLRLPKNTLSWKLELVDDSGDASGGGLRHRIEIALHREDFLGLSEMIESLDEDGLAELVALIDVSGVTFAEKSVVVEAFWRWICSVKSMKS